MANLQNLTKQSNQSTDTALYDAVSKGMLMLIFRGIKYAPPREELGQRAALLVEDLKAEGLTNSLAVENAFNAIGRTCSEWPDTAAIIRLIKPKVQPVMHRMLAHEKEKFYTDDEVSRFSKILSGLKTKLGWTPEQKLTPDTERSLLAEARERLAKINGVAQ